MLRGEPDACIFQVFCRLLPHDKNRNHRQGSNMKELLLVCIGSFVGGGARYAISKALQAWWPSCFPWGTLTVNVVGCFLIGLLSGLALGHHLSPTARLVLVTGFCGGFTTFSTFMNENFQLGRDGQLTLAILYTAVSVVLGLLAVVAGYQTSQ